MEGYKVFRMDRQGRRGGSVALYVRECFCVVELSAGNGNVESLWVRMKGKASKSYILLELYYKLPNHDGKFISSVCPGWRNK